MKVFLGSITLAQVGDLIEIFATLTEEGWVIPNWLAELRANVENKEQP